MFNIMKLRRALGDTFATHGALRPSPGKSDSDARLLGAILEKLNALDERTTHLLNEVEFLRKRANAYLDQGAALAYLSDQTPIFLDPRDSGPAANILNGGIYEAENIQVLLSFVRPDTVFLDIGANIGIFSLKIGQRVKSAGKVYAFEPQQHLTDLLRRSSFLNGLSSLEGTGTLESYAMGASDRTGDAGFTVPKDHFGGGFIDPRADHTIRTVRLDDLFPDDFSCDLVKIDIEGHELPALMGMRRILSTSPNPKIMFEKLGRDAGYEDAIETYFSDLGFSIFNVNARARLVPVPRGQLGRGAGTFLAARPGDPDVAETDRRRMFIYPSQLTLRAATLADGALLATPGAADIAFHGPYWFLPRGQYRIRLHGELSGELDLTIANRFGYPMTSCRFSRRNLEAAFTIERDAVLFECVGRLRGALAQLALRKIEIMDL